MQKWIVALFVIMLLGCAPQPYVEPVEEVVEEQIVEQPEVIEPIAEEIVGDARLYDSMDACKESNADCVQLLDDGLSGKFVAFGMVNEGEAFELDFGQTSNGVCGMGLSPIKMFKSVDGKCVAPACACYVCAKCGNDECGAGENECNCPQDCKEKENLLQAYPSKEMCEATGKKCAQILKENLALSGKFIPFGNVKEGQVVGLDLSESPEGLCAEGSPLGIAHPYWNERSCAIPMSPIFTCAFCGDGECGMGENICSCPKDCFGEVPDWQNAESGVWLKKATTTGCESNKYHLCVSECYENTDVVTEFAKDAWNPQSCEWDESDARMEMTDTGLEVLCFEPGCRPQEDCTVKCEAGYWDAR